MKFKVDQGHVYSVLKFLAWVLLAIVVAFVIGALIGYGMSGKGSPFSVFSPHTWQHILDFLR
ncbi:DNA-directed RNA polymerase subunit beta [Lapidilactobacillus gannanensis]|uniref:DNA-directed RNA polymerase subunit beta n=1 Tax=Lapidilactobacillus gannanensis TaxID=2486002 RepID=A0ABW4BLI8_9LACO|nr:DNA-directed RNA polymerase subunit beta [Lapidilactobacillus gannanensis]MCH4057765.1 DNA-directed RNA polymerase subunit beta [Lactobacillaceae bacterium]